MLSLQADDLPEVPPQSVTEEAFTDRHGNMVVKKVGRPPERSRRWWAAPQGVCLLHQVTRKVIKKYVSADGSLMEEVRVEGSQQGSVAIQEGDAVSRVTKRTVLHSQGDRTEVGVSLWVHNQEVLGPGEADGGFCAATCSTRTQTHGRLVLCAQLTFSEPRVLEAATSSQFEVEPVQGRKVSKVVKTTVVRGERVEKRTGDSSLAADLPSAREDFEKVSVSGWVGQGWWEAPGSCPISGPCQILLFPTGSELRWQLRGRTSAPRGRDRDCTGRWFCGEKVGQLQQSRMVC